MNMGKKKNYESPFVKRAQVETESGFCAASVIDKTETIKTEGHEIGNNFDAGTEGWNSDNAWE